MPQIRTTTDIRAPVERVFTYVTTPSNWPQWHVNSLGVSGATDHPLQPGEQVTEEFKFGRSRGVVTWTVRERVEPSRWVITGQVVGGGDGTISYSLTTRDDVTNYQRDFVYRMPNPFVWLLDKLVLRSRIAADARRSVQRLKEVLEADA